jgi:hypothetical protein
MKRLPWKNFPNGIASMNCMLKNVRKITVRPDPEDAEVPLLQDGLKENRKTKLRAKRYKIFLSRLPVCG